MAAMGFAVAVALTGAGVEEVSPMDSVSFVCSSSFSSTAAILLFMLPAIMPAPHRPPSSGWK